MRVSLSRTHPIRRGDFPILVFSGRRASFGDLPSEETFGMHRKYAVPDPRLPNGDDLAHALDQVLARWPEDRIEPTDGVCFIFDDYDHPFAAKMRAIGASEQQHYIVLQPERARERPGAREALDAFLDGLAQDATTVVLGYGHQGSKTASHLVRVRSVPPDRICVIDHNRDSAQAARADGFEVLGDLPAGDSPLAVVYTPLHHHRRLWQMVERAQIREIPTFVPPAEASHDDGFITRGPINLTPAADRVIECLDARFRRRAGAPPIDVFVMREDQRRIGDLAFAHLHGFQRASFHNDADAEIDLALPDPTDSFPHDTCDHWIRAWVGMSAAEALGVMAARAFCAQFWPNAIRRVMPARHEVELGATSFERLLLRHLGRCEVAMASQTSAQQAALGILAAHYAGDAPIIEIGSALGGSALLMAAATAQLRPHIISIDPDTATRDVMRFIFDRESEGDRLMQIIKPSSAAIRDLSHLSDAAGVVFIDGQHTRDAVIDDFRNYAPLVRIGGVLLFHDVAPAWCDVMDVVLNIVCTDARFEMKCMIDSLAVLERVE